MSAVSLFNYPTYLKTPQKRQPPITTELIIQAIAAKLPARDLCCFSRSCKRIYNSNIAQLYRAKLIEYLVSQFLGGLYLTPKRSLEDHIRALWDVRIHNASLIQAFGGLFPIQALPILEVKRMIDPHHPYFFLPSDLSAPIMRGQDCQNVTFIAFRYVYRRVLNGAIFENIFVETYLERNWKAGFLKRLIPKRKGSKAEREYHILGKPAQIMVGNNEDFNVGRLKRLLQHKPVGAIDLLGESTTRVVSNGQSQIELV